VALSARILLVEDEDAIAAFVATALEREGYTVSRVSTGQEALSYIRRAVPDLVLLDLMLPGDVDGLQVCQAVRGGEVYIPIIMVTAKDEDVDKVVGLEMGADDYITKPFNARELLARVRAVLRLVRSEGEVHHRERLHVGPLEIDLAGREVRVEGRSASLTPKEFDLLVVLARSPGRVFGRETLLQQVWGYDYLGDSRTVDVHVQRLRRKIEPDPANPRYLLTVHGIGYKFAAEEV
jgi:two-component system response regulator RegX3